MDLFNNQKKRATKVVTDCFEHQVFQMLLLLLCCCGGGDVVVVHFMRFFPLRVFCPVNGVLHLADQQEGNTV